MNIMELFAHIGLKADTPAAEAFNKSIGNIKTQLVGAIAGTLSLAAAVATFNDQMNKSLAMKRFADDTGESVEEMQKWKAVAQQVSGAGDSVAASIRAISSNQAKIRLGQGNISGYQLLGIDSRSDPFEVLEALRTKTQGLSQSMRRNIASQFGISNDLVATLELTNEEFERMSSHAFVIPQQNIDAMNRARASLETVKNALNFLAAQFVTALAPSVEPASKKIAKFVSKHGAKAGEWMKTIITTISRVSELIDSTIRKTIGWERALFALAAAFIMLNSAIMLPVAAIALLFIALEDIYAYSKGEDSLIGRFLEGMPALKEAFDGVLETLSLLVTALGSVFSGDFSKLDEMTKKWGLFGDVLQVVARALNIINTGLSSKSFNASVEGIKEKGFFQQYAEEWGNLGRMITSTDWLGTKSQEAVAAPVTINNNPVVTITGAANPEVTGRYAAEAIARENQKAFDRLAGEKREK